MNDWKVIIPERKYKAGECRYQPHDYYEKIKENIATEFAERYVKRTAYEKVMENLFLYLNEIERRVTLIEKKLKKIEVPEEQEIEFVEVPEEQAVLEYIRKNPGCRTSDIIFNLRLNPDFVMKVLKKLKDKQKIRGESIVWRI